MTSEKPSWGKVLAEGLSAMLSVRKVSLVRMSPKDHLELLRYAHSSLPLETFPRDLLKFMDVPLEVAPTVEPGFAVYKTSEGDEKSVEFQVLWDLLHEVPTDRFHRIDRDIV
jgi:hypothetical protein